MKKIISLLVALLTLAACSDTLNEGSTPSNKNGVEDGGITLTINLPDFTKEELTRAGSLAHLHAITYDKNNNCLSCQEISTGNVTIDENGKAKVRLPLTNDAETIHIVAYVSSLTKEQCQGGLDQTTVSGTIDMDKPICWGYAKISDLLNNPDYEVTLLRMFAKVKVVEESKPSADFIGDGTFTLAGYKLYNAADQGTIAPTGLDYNATTPNIPTTVTYNSNSGDWTTAEIPFYESAAAANQAYLIIKGEYEGKEGYYKVAFYNGDNTFMSLLRNHAYTVKIIHVNTKGWDTEAKAMADPYPENRMKVDVIDDNPNITDMIACKDYHLGVSDQVSAAWNDSTTATLVTTIKDGSWKVESKDADWIGKISISATIDIPDAAGPNSTSGKKYRLSIPLTENRYSEETREGHVVVRSGDLTRTITITQKGNDFKRSDTRTVILLDKSDNRQISDDYFHNFIDQTQGIKPEDLQYGTVRNDGLHFTVVSNRYRYWIPKNESNETCTKGSENSDRYTIQEITNNRKSYWQVDLVNNEDNNFNFWKGDFTISYTTSDGHTINIKYPVYHSGIFHEISDAHQQPPVDPNGNGEEKLPTVKGRFYYGVIKVQGKNKTYIMLDRNLGASNNGNYSIETKALQANRNAIGGYFQIANEKRAQNLAGSLLKDLIPHGFKIPENDDIQDIIDGGKLKVVNRYTESGEVYNSIEITTVNSVLPTIYLPTTGYVEGESLKNPTHVSLWTKTLLSGNQGFDTTSPEYGFWYRYFDIYGRIMTLSNLRFVSGSNGRNTGIYRAMPIRLVHVLQ
ncbi:hypothetical protein DW830_02890 [Prevotella sp. AM34-19LB]|uniref:lipoprotein n=1 Tax=Prevotella sp. AM34-19LB TaxID=2292364 RepID=UPI000E5D802A|nr:hypothetical protein DW830_02890 [Prevotella sp. AM34-19LB]